MGGHDDSIVTKGKKPTRSPPALIAKVIVRAETGPQTSDQVNKGKDERIIEKIRKCLARAKHPAANQSEAETALYQASRFMAIYNISHADLAATAKTSEEQAQLGGQSTVSIRRVDSIVKARVNNQRWFQDVGHAMTIFWNCSLYTSATSFSVDYTFYGIAMNTVLAAESFEIAINLAMDWVRFVKGQKASYCLGISAGLYQLARRQKKEEERAAKMKEEEEEAQCEASRKESDDQAERQRQEKIEALEDNVKDGISDCETDPEAYLSDGVQDSGPQAGQDIGDHWESDAGIQTTFKQEIDDEFDIKLDLEAELDRVIRGAQLGADGSGGASKDQSLWKSHSALVLFRQSAVTVAKEYIRARGLKLKTKSYKNKGKVRDWNAYEKGKEDSKNIDVKKRKIKA